MGAHTNFSSSLVSLVSLLSLQLLAGRLLGRQLGQSDRLGEHSPAQVLGYDTKPILGLLQLLVKLVVLSPALLLTPQDVQNLLVL